MTSYHRILDIFGRSVNQKSVECDYDIHPWDILVDGERWTGKIRLIGFVDVFFLICYSGTSRFDHGLMIFKDDDAIRHTLKRADVQADTIGLTVVNTKKVEEGKEPRKYFSFESTKGGLDYIVTSLGMPIGMKTEYPRSSLQEHVVKVRKGRSAIMKNQLRRGLMQHGPFDLIQDAIRLAVITHAELISFVVRETVGGSTTHDLAGKYMTNITGGGGGKDLGLSGQAE